MVSSLLTAIVSPVGLVLVLIVAMIGFVVGASCEGTTGTARVGSVLAAPLIAFLGLFGLGLVIGLLGGQPLRRAVGGFFFVAIPVLCVSPVAAVTCACGLTTHRRSRTPL